MKETIADRNKAFWKLGKKAKRIAIARDIIRQLRLGKIKPRQGGYVELPTEPEEDRKLDVFIRKQSKPCQACALGACMLAIVNLGDRVNISDVFDRRGSCFGTIIGDDEMRGYIRDIFSSQQMILIESAFEKCDFRHAEGDTSFGDSPPEVLSAIRFGRKHTKVADRMTAIMKNIIHNEGKFCP